MEDLYNTSIICDACNEKTNKVIVDRTGFKLRGWECPGCKKVWTHPSDQQEYDKFKQIKKKEFNVKLRMVGNSYTVSIPREIIEFENLEKELNNLINMSLEEPGKLSIFFSRRIRKFY